MAQIEIITETEQDRGWRFDARVLDDGGTLRTQAVTLGWADYNLWSPDGGAAPEHIAAAVLQFMLDRIPPDELKSSFDASIARRMFPDADDVIPQLVTHGQAGPEERRSG